jgi:hypothetical protein
MPPINKLRGQLLRIKKSFKIRINFQFNSVFSKHLTQEGGWEIQLNTPETGHYNLLSGPLNAIATWHFHR